MTSIWLLNILVLSVPDEGYTGNTSWLVISTFVLAYVHLH